MVLGFGDSTKGMTRIWDHFVILVVCGLVIFKPQIMLRPNRTISKSYWIQEYNYIRTLTVHIFYLLGTLGIYQRNGYRNGRPRYVKYGGNWPSWGYPTMYLTWHHNAWAVRAQTWGGPSHPILWTRSLDNWKQCPV